MTRQDEVNNEYFLWLCDLVCKDRFARQISYKKLLTFLHLTEFKCALSRDKNRAEDGICLRYRFGYENTYIDNAEGYINGPCSVLEMMVALALHCEENIMDDPSMGNRTGQWFWGMVTNLGLGGMSDERFDRLIAETIINRFLKREYEPNGKGGLFTIRNCDVDLRSVEIWYQLCWYLDGIT